MERTYLGERGLFCPPDLKIFLHLDFGFLQQMLKVFNLGLKGSKASEAVLVTNQGNRQCLSHKRNTGQKLMNDLRKLKS